MFKPGDVIICLNPDHSHGLFGIVKFCPTLWSAKYLVMYAFCDPDLTNWALMRGGWEIDRCIAHPDPDLVLASYTAAVLLGKANND